MQLCKAVKSFYGCQCFYTRNYYLKEYNLHVEYNNNHEEFLSTYKKALRDRGCKSRQQIEDVLKALDTEYYRRKSIVIDSVERRSLIRTSYVPLHKEVYTLKESYLDEKFIALVEFAKSPAACYETLLEKVQREGAEEVFRFPVFTKRFCELLLEELQHFENSEFPKSRPNTMNQTGIILGELGFDKEFLTPLRCEYLNPVGHILYPEWVGKELDSHRAFTVKYTEETDVHLGFHYDNAEVTLNVSLGKDFDDGSLYFGSMRQDTMSSENAKEVKHVAGEGVFHRGQHMHGAMPISYGERTNLIMWMRSSSVRNRLCPMCDSERHLTSMPGFGDGFTKDAAETVQLCNLT